MSKQKTYETFREARSNSDATSRMLDIFRATEPGIIMETPEMAETINEIVRFSVSEDARNIGPRWMGVRPEVIVTSFTEYPQEYRLVKASKNTKSDGSVSLTYTEPVEGNGDYDEEVCMQRHFLTETQLTVMKSYWNLFQSQRQLKRWAHPSKSNSITKPQQNESV